MSVFVVSGLSYAASPLENKVNDEKYSRKVYEPSKHLNHFYLVMWDTKSIVDKKAFDQYLPEQANRLLQLWKAGKIENIYLDPEPTDSKGLRTGTVVFFIKADSYENAEKVLLEMPFVQKKIVTYSLQEVGMFWLGQPADLKQK